MTGETTGPRPRRGAWMIAAAIAAGALLAAGVGSAVFGGSGSPPPGPGGGGDAVVRAADVVHFEQGHGLAPVRTMLRSPADVTAFAGWFPQDGLGAELKERLLGRDLAEEALVAMGWSSGCTSAEGAVLTYAPGTGYSARLTGTTSYEECSEPWDVLAVFAVPERDVGADPAIGGDSPDPPGPTELLAYAPLGEGAAAREPRGAEVSQADQLAAFLAPLPGRPAMALERELGGIYEGTFPGGARRFAFEGRGCGDDLLLEITAERLRPVPAGGASCRRPRPYAAVFTVPADRVPPSVVIGG